MQATQGGLHWLCQSTCALLHTLPRSCTAWQPCGEEEISSSYDCWRPGHAACIFKMMQGLRCNARAHRAL